MLKTTYRAVEPSTSQEAPLPPGWTEHKAPTGHSYFYHLESKQSTYSRPLAVPKTLAPVVDFGSTNLLTPVQGQVSSQFGAAGGHGSRHDGGFPNRFSHRNRPHGQPDRPKKKRAIPGCEPWVLVETKLGRRFVYHPEKNESYWKFPQDVLLATFEMDKQRPEAEKTPQSVGPARLTGAENPATIEPNESQKGHDSLHDSDSYEEVEVTDNEEIAGSDGDEEVPPKKARTEHSAHDEPAGPVEFDEDDMAYQLAQMGQDYGLDPEEYDDGEVEHENGLPLSFEDSQALFYDLLSDNAVNPYSTWEAIIEEGRIIDDERYVALPSMRARNEAFTVWSTEQIQQLKRSRALQDEKDPKIPYLSFLHEHATPKLYWPEFKRKHRKETMMKDSRLSDKDREKLYREHINHLKQPESTRKAEFKTLLKSIPIQDLNRRSTLDALPSCVLTDLRFICLSPNPRDELLEVYISTLPPPPSSSKASTKEDQETRARAAEREKREQALRERERMVQEEKRTIMGRLRQGREILREEEKEIEEALRIKGMAGLKGYMQEGS